MKCQKYNYPYFLHTTYMQNRNNKIGRSVLVTKTSNLHCKMVKTGEKNMKNEKMNTKKFRYKKSLYE